MPRRTRGLPPPPPNGRPGGPSRMGAGRRNRQARQPRTRSSTHQARSILTRAADPRMSIDAAINVTDKAPEERGVPRRCRQPPAKTAAPYPVHLQETSASPRTPRPRRQPDQRRPIAGTYHTHASPRHNCRSAPRSSLAPSLGLDCRIRRTESAVRRPGLTQCDQPRGPWAHTSPPICVPAVAPGWASDGVQNS